MSIKALQEYTRFSKYARYNFDAGRRESWEEQVDRVFNMHRERFGDEIISLIQDDFEFAKKMVIQKRVLGSQRALQFGGKPILTKNDRIYNCSASYCDRPRFFQECMYLLLCGCGTGFSVQKEHVAKLPPLIKEKNNGVKVFKIADDIEGWADSIGVLMSSYFDSDSTPFPEYKGYKVEFDVSAIRPQGSPISSGSKAPGPEPLYQALVKIDHLLDKTSKKKDKLDPIDAYDVVMYASDAVLSGGVRRCIAYGSSVLVRGAGFKNIEDVKIGDMVSTSDGWQMVKNVFDQGKQKIVRVKHQDGYINCTPNHRFAVLQSVYGDYIWKRADELTENDYLFFVHNEANDSDAINSFPDFKYEKPAHSTTCKDIIIPELDEEMAWFIGEVQGDGYIYLRDGDGMVSVAVEGENPSKAIRIANCMERFGVNTYLIEPSDTDNCYRVNTKSKQLALFLHEHVKQPNKVLYVPSFIRNASKRIKVAYVQGVLDADGSIGERCQNVVTSVYESFVKDIQNLLYSVGIISRFRKLSIANLKDGWKEKYGLFIVNNYDRELFNDLSCDFAYKKFRVSKYQQKSNAYPMKFINEIRNKPKNYWRKICTGNKRVAYSTAIEVFKDIPENIKPIKVISVENDGEAYTYDIEVENNHSFICEGVLVHNSATICIFSADDEDMLKAKTGSWFIENKQRSRSNNSVLLIRDETDKDHFLKIIESVKEYGEPGFIWADHKDFLVNPCAEISFFAKMKITEENKHEFLDEIKMQGDDKFLSGWGYCVSGDTNLIIKNGITKIKDAVNKNIEIWNGEKWCKVKPFVTGNDRELYRVHLSDGSYLDCTGNHKWLVKDRFMGEYIEVETKDLESVSKYKIHTPPPHVVFNDGVYEEYAYEYGFILGDGYCNRNDTVKKIRTPVADLFNGDMSLPLRYRVVKYGKNSNGTNYRAVSFDDVDKDFSYKMKYEKGLPKEIFTWDRKSLLNFIAGWIDSDGARASRGFRIYGSESKIRDAQLLMTKLGVYSHISLFGEKGQETNLGLRKNAVWYVQVNDIKDIYSHKIDLNKTRRKQNGKGMYQIIDRVEKLNGLHTTYCLEEKEKHLCLFNNVITHQCNLCEINVKKAKTESEFLDACRASAILGTLQAGYTTFNYLGRVSEEICRSEALLGVSMTGMADNPEIAFDPKLQRKGAKLILEVNERIAKIIGINSSARTTCIKPAGSSSCILGTASGIHPHHAKRYFRRVQANKIEVPLQYFEKFNPMAVEQSVWNQNDKIISFLCEVPDGAKTKNSMNAIAMLDLVKLTQQNWVESGVRSERCLQPWLRHNVSNTINIRPEEWDDVGEYIYKNRKWFTGISMLPMSGDKDYPQAPFCAVYTPSEIVKEYGDGSIMASGLIVDGLRVFKNDLFAACDCALGIGEIIDVDSLRSKIESDCETNGSQWKKEGLSGSSPEKLLRAWLQSEVKDYIGKSDWVRRAIQFANRYFGGDIKKMTYCLKDVANWKLWCDLQREYVAIDWSQCFEDDDGNLEFGGAGSACSGGACDLGDLGLAIAQHKEDKKTAGKSLLET